MRKFEIIATSSLFMIGAACQNAENTVNEPIGYSLPEQVVLPICTETNTPQKNGEFIHARILEDLENAPRSDGEYYRILATCTGGDFLAALLYTPVLEDGEIGKSKDVVVRERIKKIGENSGKLKVGEITYSSVVVSETSEDPTN